MKKILFFICLLLGFNSYSQLIVTKQNGSIVFDFGDGQPKSLSINDPKSFSIGQSTLYIKLQSNKFSKEVLKTSISSIDGVTVTSGMTIYDVISRLDGLFGNPTTLGTTTSTTTETLTSGSVTVTAGTIKRLSINPTSGSYTIKTGTLATTGTLTDYYDTGFTGGYINTTFIITWVSGTIYISKTY